MTGPLARHHPARHPTFMASSSTAPSTAPATPAATPAAAAPAVTAAAPAGEPRLQDERWRQHWLRQWYAVACLRDLDPRRPFAFTLLDQDLVIWWDAAAQQWRAFADVCPHRLVPLSEGRLNERGELECPYHGWSFDGAGHCTAIPQAAPEVAATACASGRSRCRAYATAAAQGLLFVFAGDAADAAAVPLPLVPLLEEEGWLVQDTFRDLPMDALTLLENVLDVSHVPFTHHRTVGRRDNAAPVDAELTGAGPGGFTATWAEGPRRGKLGSQHTTFVAPGLMWHDLDAKAFARFLTVVYATPTHRGACRLIARFPFRFRSPLPRLLLGLTPRWLQHVGNHTVLEDDQVFLHWQERALAERGGSGRFTRACYLPTGADVYVKALHEWVVEHGGEPFPGQPLPPRQGLAPLMDRFEAHTRHCRSCREAHGRIRRWRPRLQALLLLVPLALLAVVWLGLLAASAALLAAGLGAVLLLGALERQLARWQRGLERGSGEPPRNALAR
jgi:phenylpropionate dioxygenase-like ring-hydroxylating dioxygenase large terminal subunit